MANQEFDEAVAAAKADGSAARKQLGISYAAEFKNEPEIFDPRKLQILGREGLSSFLTAVNVPAREFDPPAEPPAEIEIPNDTDRNWTNQQMVSLPFEFRAFMFGAMAGIGIILGSAIILSP